MRQQDLGAETATGLGDAETNTLSFEIGNCFHSRIVRNHDLRRVGVRDRQSRDRVAAMAQELVGFYGVECDEIERQSKIDVSTVQCAERAHHAGVLDELDRNGWQPAAEDIVQTAGDQTGDGPWPMDGNPYS